MINQFYSMTYMLLMMSTLLAVSSTNWLFMWMAMELNLLCFIPLMIASSQFQETEATVKYFLIQALGSSLLLMSSTTIMFNFPQMMISMTILTLSLSLKMGLAPLHLWYPSVMSSITWMNCLILSTWQKLAPLMYLTLVLSLNIKPLMLVMASLSALLGGLMGMNQSKIRSIMAYSSITHLGWMTALMLYKPLFTLIYFLIYSTIITPLFLLFNMNVTMYISTISHTLSSNKTMNVMIPMLLLSLSGIPPLTGFMPKWMTILILADTNTLLLIILIIGSLMSTYYYLSLLFTCLLSYSNSSTRTLKLSHPYQFYTTLIATFTLFIMPFMLML